MDILTIKNFPTTLENMHESVFRSFQTLQKVKEMLARDDSRESILEVISVIESHDKQPSPTKGPPSVSVFSA